MIASTQTFGRVALGCCPLSISIKPYGITVKPHQMIFNELGWLIMSSILLCSVLTMFVGQLVMAGGWQWWAWIMLAMVGLAACLVKLAWNEYKKSK